MYRLRTLIQFKFENKIYPVNSMAWSWDGKSLLLLIQDRKSFSASSALSNSRGVPGSFFTSVHTYESLLCLYIIRTPFYIQRWLIQLYMIILKAEHPFKYLIWDKEVIFKVNSTRNLDLIYLRPRAIWQPHSRGSSGPSLSFHGTLSQP